MFKWFKNKTAKPDFPYMDNVKSADVDKTTQMTVSLYERINQYIQLNYVDYSNVKFSLKKSTDTTLKRLELKDNKLIWIEDDSSAPTFSNRVKQIMTEKELSAAELCSRILMDRRLFSKLNTDIDYKPSKETAIAICIGLRLSYEEALVLLQRAGYTLSNGIKYDVVITYFLKNSIYDIDIINDILYQFELKCIGTKL